ncbi:ABC transporter ATP-binding protein [Dictyobacter aurantiacus]|uniref:ABC transporter ATP-binding protein n=1 Tax=Dictyobacter aurantiacus TaxID=1936993 RepID=A0A401ZF74_9CHLR|nr:ABC transporter ATP-binding protein [Dictyobacter aurantiacus]GCE05496.1 ABC transporter ATP-binding protein [Dictyobacter aurantiacus]
MKDLIQVNNLSKTYGKQRGIHNVTFSIAEGEVFGFLGPNGAGKTTTIRTLMGFLKPTSGQALIGGLDCWSQATQIKRMVGYLPGEFSFDPNMTGAQILSYLGHLRGGVDQQYVKQLIERLDFDPAKRFHTYSRGNKQKIGLVQAFMHKPQLLILDEPTGGLDPLNQQEFNKMITEVSTAGQTVFLSSHILPEVEHTCTRVGIIREGELVRVSEVSTLKDLKQSNILIHFTAEPELAWFNGLPGVINVQREQHGHALLITVQGEQQAVIQAAAQHQAISMTTHEPGLEEIFLRFYQKETRPDAIAI